MVSLLLPVPEVPLPMLPDDELPLLRRRRMLLSSTPVLSLPVPVPVPLPLVELPPAYAPLVELPLPALLAPELEPELPLPLPLDPAPACATSVYPAKCLLPRGRSVLTCSTTAGGVSAAGVELMYMTMFNLLARCH